MGYDLFKDLQKKYGIPCPQIYAKLFKKVKFMPGTMESTIDDNESSKNNVTSIFTKDVAFVGDMFQVNIETEKTFFSDNVIDKIYFAYNFSYFVISNIHVVDEGVVFDYECYDTDTFKKVSMELNDANPRPEAFVAADQKPFYKDTGFIGNKDKINAINLILFKYLEAKARKVLDTPRSRV